MPSVRRLPRDLRAQRKPYSGSPAAPSSTSWAAARWQTGARLLPGYHLGARILVAGRTVQRRASTIIGHPHHLLPYWPHHPSGTCACQERSAPHATLVRGRRQHPPQKPAHRRQPGGLGADIRRETSAGPAARPRVLTYRFPFRRPFVLRLERLRSQAAISSRVIPPRATAVMNSNTSGGGLSTRR